MVTNLIGNGIGYIGMNCKKPPFDNVKVRQAVAYAIPYQKIMDAVLFGLARPMYGAQADAPTQVAWPQPHPYNTDIAKAKALLAEAGYPERLRDDACRSISALRVINEPLCVLVQESLAQIGIKATINKMPGANWRTELLKKEMPLIANFFSGWLDYPEYFFFWCYHGQNAVFNTMSYQDKEMDALIDAARKAAADGDTATYEKNVKGFVDKSFAEVPRIPLFQPYAQRGDAEERLRLPRTGSTASSTIARWSRPRGCRSCSHTRHPGSRDVVEAVRDLRRSRLASARASAAGMTGRGVRSPV